MFALTSKSRFGLAAVLISPTHLSPGGNPLTPSQISAWLLGIFLSRFLSVLGEPPAQELQGSHCNEKHTISSNSNYNFQFFHSSSWPPVPLFSITQKWNHTTEFLVCHLIRCFLRNLHQSLHRYLQEPLTSHLVTTWPKHCSQLFVNTEKEA